MLFASHSYLKGVAGRSGGPWLARAACPPAACASSQAAAAAAAAAIMHAPPCRPFSLPRCSARSAAAARRGPPAVAVSAPQRPQAATSAASPSDRAAAGRGEGVPVKVVGVGTRGASALAKLIEHGKVAGAELWCLDVDQKVTDRVPEAQALLVPKEGTADDAQGPLSAEELLSIVGRGASDAGGRGNIGSGDGGLAFVVAPAAAVPGGPKVVMQLVAALRAAGHFTVVALTQPFEFEGGAKAEQAARLVAALRSSAHLVALMEQDVLMQAFGDSQLTVAEATDIADNALEHTVRAVLQAVQAQEVLRSSRGALMWHGRDLRHFRRLISPPLQALLSSSTNTGVLGRGLAAMPGDVAQQMGSSKALMHLASDAVRAAAESPFLEGALDSAAGVLCCLTLPAGSAELDRQATRMAVQAAAGALTSITGAQCDDFIMCADPRQQDAAAAGGKVEVEATLLVLRPAGAPSAAAVAARTAAAAAAARAAQPSAAPAPAPPQPSLPAQPQRLPPSTWNALSAMAGGTVKARPAPAHGEPAARAPPAAQPKPAQRDSSAAPAKGAPGLSFFQGGGAAAARQQPAPAPARRDPSVGVPQQPAQRRQPPQQQVPSQQAPSQRQQPQQQAEPSQQAQQEPKVTVGDYLVDSLTAQSLDLPPAAARWRQEKRAADTQPRKKLIVWEVDQLEPWEEEEEENEGIAGLLLGGGGKRERRVKLRERVEEILQQDREEAWQAEEEGQQQQG